MLANGMFFGLLTCRQMGLICLHVGKWVFFGLRWFAFWFAYMLANGLDLPTCWLMGIFGLPTCWQMDIFGLPTCWQMGRICLHVSKCSLVCLHVGKPRSLLKGFWQIKNRY